MGLGAIIDWTVLELSPTRGRARIMARQQALALMTFDAASRGRRLRSWRAPSSDADAASLAGRARMRQLSRDMDRNAPFAARAKAVIKGNVVGKGITPSIVCANPRNKAFAERVVLGHLNSSDFDFYGERNIAALQRTVMDAVFESGEVLCLRRTAPRAKGFQLPLQIQVLEVDHLDPTIYEHGGNEVRDGVEYDSDERIVAYHLYEQHPGAITTKGQRLASNRWPATEVMFIRRLDRPGQTRGWPWLAPVMVTLGEMRDYQEAQILKQKMSALLAGVVTLADGEAAPESSGLDALSPGALVYAEAGEQVTWTDPPKVDDYETVMRHGIAAVAMGLGITYESLAGDLSRVNFASSRVGRIEMDRNTATWQQDILIDQFCKGIERWILEAARLTEQRARLKNVGLEWTPQAKPIVDPNKELDPMIKEIDAGLTSRQRVIRERGRDPDTIAREREEDASRDQLLAPADPPEDARAEHSAAEQTAKAKDTA